MRHIGLALAVCLLALTILVPGCGRKNPPAGGVAGTKKSTRPIEAPPPPAIPPPAARVERESKPPPFSAILEDQLGMPLYPGVKQKDLSIGNDDKGNKVIMVSLTTEDGFDKVLGFYRRALPGYTESDITKTKGSQFGGFRRSLGSNSSLVVIESPSKGPTKIDVTVTKPQSQ